MLNVICSIHLSYRQVIVRETFLQQTDHRLQAILSVHLLCYLIILSKGI